MNTESGGKYKSQHGEPMYMFRPEEIAFRKEALFAWKQKRAAGAFFPTQLPRIPQSPKLQGNKFEECLSSSKYSQPFPPALRELVLTSQGADNSDVGAKQSSTTSTQILEIEPSGPPLTERSFPSKNRPDGRPKTEIWDPLNMLPQVDERNQPTEEI